MVKKQKQTLKDVQTAGLSNGEPAPARLRKKQVVRDARGIPRGLKVLMYHRIVNDKQLAEKSSLCLHTSTFRKHLEMINRLGLTPVTFRDVKLFMQGKLRLPKKPVIITFDDGYLDTYSNACPLMIDYGMRAVIFVMGDRKLIDNAWDKKNIRVPIAPLMSDGQIKELHEKGFEIGAHSVNHSDLNKMTWDEAYSEVKNSKLILESILGCPVLSFAYPYGSLNSKVKLITEDCGFHFACSVYSGPPAFGKDLFEIRRLTIKNSTTSGKLFLRLKTPYEYAEWLWWLIKRAVK